MNAFERMGAAQLLAMEGEQLIAAAIARLVSRELARILDILGRNRPERSYAPW